MSIIDLYVFFQPLINLLGTLCLIVLIAGSVLYLMYQIIKRIWKGLVALGVVFFCVLIAVALWGGM